LFDQFLQHKKEGRISSPENDCAVSIYNKFQVNEDSRIAGGYMKLILIQKLQEGFDALVQSVYTDQLEKFDFDKRFEITGNTRICIQLVGQRHYLYNQLRARLLFLEASDASTGIIQGAPNDSHLQGKLRDGIETLKEAIKLDPFAPYLYLRIGDYFLYSNSPEAAVSAYSVYHRFLPNDEYATNKLGLAYYQLGQYPIAKELFAKALIINPRFFQAQENLKIVIAKLQ
jgi:tetratricopeptide (TPR) repeat protein